jgi:hypothetical protein
MSFNRQQHFFTEGICDVHTQRAVFSWYILDESRVRRPTAWGIPRDQPWGLIRTGGLSWTTVPVTPRAGHKPSSSVEFRGQWLCGSITGYHNSKMYAQDLPGAHTFRARRVDSGGGDDAQGASGPLNAYGSYPDAHACQPSLSGMCGFRHRSDNEGPHRVSNHLSTAGIQVSGFWQGSPLFHLQVPRLQRANHEVRFHRSTGALCRLAPFRRRFGTI